MYRKWILSISVLLLLNIVGSASGDLVARWKLDEGSGLTAKDSVGGIEGILLNGPIWVPGVHGGALQFDGVDDCVNLGNNDIFNPTGSFSVALWANIEAWASEWGHSMIGNRGDAAGWTIRHFGSWWASQNASQWPQPASAICFTTRGIGNTANGVEDTPTNEAPPLNEWIHVACVYDNVNNVKYIYINGEQQAKVSTNAGAITAATQRFYLGAISNSANTGQESYFTGMLDDVRLYDSPLSEAEVLDVMEARESGVASKPDPADGATDVYRETALAWTPAKTAIAHDVYFGTSFDDVNAATRENPMGSLIAQGQDANSILPGRLELGQTYYWRVDEVNAPPNTSIFKGETWSFEVEPVLYKLANITATASSTRPGNGPEKTIDGSGLDANDLESTDLETMWTTASNPTTPVWIQYDFDRLYKLAEMWVWNHNTAFEWVLGFGFKDVTIEYSTNGTDWTTLGDYEFAQAPSEDGYAHDTIDLGGIAAKHVRLTANSNWGGTQYGLSEVRFYFDPVQPRYPVPAVGATGISVDVRLKWRPGREAASHKVSLSENRQAVANGAAVVDTVAMNQYDPTSLDLGKTYYWRVDEVNGAETPNTWEGDVWNFTTTDFRVVDDMESYTDNEGSRIFDTWSDGWDVPTNGSQVGYGDSPFAEQANVHGGKQSMPFTYDNTAGVIISEATRTFEPSQDWTQAGVRTFVLYFYGEPNNAAGQLYLKINGTKIPYNGDAGDLSRRRWNQWNVDLSTLSASTLRAVKTLTIGVGIGTTGGAGKLLIDDIRLYRVAPAIPVAADPGTAGLVAYYAFNNNVQDGSGGGNNGTVVGAPTYVPGPAGYGTAMQFNGTSDAVNLGANKAAFNPTGSFSISLWANIGAWTTGWEHVMISNRGESSVGWQVRRYNTSSLCFTTRGTGEEDMPSLREPPLSEWVHIACVYDNVANVKTIYINGLQDNQVPTTAGARIAATTVRAYIGSRIDSGNTGPEAFFTGKLDEIRVFSRALSAGEVAFLSDPTP
jgi:hypothetical protein